MQPSRLAQLNPLTRLALCFIFGVPLLFSVDWVSSSVGVLVVLIFAVFLQVPLKQVARRLLPIWIAAPISAISMLLYGNPQGTHFFDLGLIHITSNSVELAIAIFIRVFAVALPVLCFGVGMDIVRLGDALAQLLKLPARFVVGIIAGLSLLTLFQRDWEALERARRSRGLADHGKLVTWFQMSFALLVLALRRGTKLATAMEARGLGAPHPRTWARPSQLQRQDLYSILVALCGVVVIVGSAVFAGTWFFLD